ALAGALALVNEDTAWVLQALNRALENGYNDNHLTNEVWVYRCHEVDVTSPVDCGPYNGNPDYVQVAIESRVTTYFSRVIGIQETVNTVQAVTYAKEKGPFYDGNLIVALNPNPCSGQSGNIVLGGNSDVTLSGGGAFVNSGGSDCGMEQGGSCPTFQNGGAIGSPGDGNINLDGCANVPAPTYGADPYAFPPEMPAEPAECTSPMGTWSSNGSTQITTLSPGRYNEFPPKSTQSLTVYDTVIMNPGIYCVNDVVKLSDHHLDLYGHDVTIFIREGYDFDIQGGRIRLDAPDTGDYAGYLLIVDSNFTGQVPNCIINGDSENEYTGTIFAPYCDITINGGNDTTTYNAQMIGYTVSILGNAHTNLFYDTNNTAQSTPKIGLMR
ncbi:MAG TPA: hypothetical protein VFQ23_10990, partial [Anaerolineales bacterium]|nr:hypothetical protein [Anaerolineales bacterium]